MKVSVLVENSAGENSDLQAEFGLSMLIESAGKQILLDTGSSGIFADNAKKLGMNLGGIDHMLLSHGHFDHGGGLDAFCEQNQNTPVILRKGADRPSYGTIAPALPDLLHRSGILTRYIGLDEGILKKYADRLQWIEEDMEVSPGVWALTSIPRDHPIPNGNRFLLVRENGHYRPDDFSHELVLVVEEEGEAVVFSGCAHNGILNMLDATRRQRPELPIRAVVGGFHLNLPRSENMSAPAEEIRALAEELGRQVTGTIYTGHCTGQEAYRTMKEVLGDRLQPLHTGAQFEV